MEGMACESTVQGCLALAEVAGDLGSGCHERVAQSAFLLGVFFWVGAQPHSDLMARSHRLGKRKLTKQFVSAVVSCRGIG